MPLRSRVMQVRADARRDTVRNVCINVCGAGRFPQNGLYNSAGNLINDLTVDWREQPGADDR
jgi:hypothetical protein